MRFLRKLFIIIFTCAIFVLPTKVFAVGGITLSHSSLNLKVGESQTVTITAFNTIGNIKISISDPSVATLSTYEWEIGMVESQETHSETVTITGLNVGQSSIVFDIDAATFDEEDLSGQVKSIPITVISDEEDDPIVDFSTESASASSSSSDPQSDSSSDAAQQEGLSSELATKNSNTEKEPTNDGPIATQGASSANLNQDGNSDSPTNILPIVIISLSIIGIVTIIIFGIKKRYK